MGDWIQENTMTLSPPSTDHLQCVSLKKAAAVLDVSADTVTRLMRRGELRGAKVKGNIRVYLWSLDQYLKMNEIMPQTGQPEEQAHRPRRATGATHRAAMQRLGKLGIVNDSMAR
jgi:excisionase family DNA binding protein